MEKRLVERVTEICETSGFAAGYRYTGPALSKSSPAAQAHQTEASAFAAVVVGSPSIPPQARAEAFQVAKSAFQNGYMRGRVARSTIPPLGADQPDEYARAMYPTGVLPPRLPLPGRMPATDQQEDGLDLMGERSPTSADRKDQGSD